MKKIVLDDMLKIFKRMPIVLLVVFTLINSNAYAQNKFEPSVIVNNRIISNYELFQRLTLLNILQPQKVSSKQVLTNLINERLLEEFSEQFEIKITEKRIEDELSILANQFNLSNKDFLKELE